MLWYRVPDHSAIQEAVPTNQHSLTLAPRLATSSLWLAAPAVVMPTTRAFCRVFKAVASYSAYMPKDIKCRSVKDCAVVPSFNIHSVVSNRVVANSNKGFPTE
jgi:hypothetical protein